MTRKSAFTLIEVLIAAMILSILLAIAIPNILRSRLSSNEAIAKATLRAISTACENYATANNGIYPTQESDLLEEQPPYLNRAYSGKTIQGYTYTLNLTKEGYSITGSASKCGISGTKDYTIVTGGLLTETDCSS